MKTPAADIDKFTEIMREADKAFEKIGGSTRHYVRDVLFPLLEKNGLRIVAGENAMKTAPDGSALPEGWTAAAWDTSKFILQPIQAPAPVEVTRQTACSNP